MSHQIDLLGIDETFAAIGLNLLAEAAEKSGDGEKHEGK